MKEHLDTVPIRDVIRDRIQSNPRFLEVVNLAKLRTINFDPQPTDANLPEVPVGQISGMTRNELMTGRAALHHQVHRGL